MILQRKWKSLRDCYARELKKQKTLPSGSKPRQNTYIYFRRLQFLENSVSGKETTSNLERNTDDSLCDDEDVTVERGACGTSTKKKLKLNPADKLFADILEKSLLERRKEEEQRNDDDKLFCLSLYKELKKVPENFRLMAKIEMLNVIQRAQVCATSQAMHVVNHPQPYSQPFTHISGYTSQTPSSHQAHPTFPLHGASSTLSTTHPIHHTHSMQPHPSTSGCSNNTSVESFLNHSATPSPDVSSVSDTQCEYVNVFE